MAKIIMAERESKKQELWNKVTQAVSEYSKEFNLEIEIENQETNELLLNKRLKKIALTQEIPGYFYICI